jgi:hypothetical protein
VPVVGPETVPNSERLNRFGSDSPLYPNYNRPTKRRKENMRLGKCITFTDRSCPLSTNRRILASSERLPMLTVSASPRAFGGPSRLEIQVLIELPGDVRERIYEIFASCNQRVSAKLSLIPTTHETSLDLTFIEHVSQFAAPFAFPSEWVMRFDTHYLGGGRHFGEWEIADIGFLVLFRRQGVLVHSKICLLQSKRLYPTEEVFHEDKAVDYMREFARLLESDEDFAEAIEPRSFTFSEESKYKALVVNDRQYKLVQEYETTYNIPIHYMLYHPLALPLSRTFPIVDAKEDGGPCTLGTRVLPAADLREALKLLDDGGRPSFRELCDGTSQSPASGPGWVLEDFVVDQLMACKQGYITEQRNDDGLRQIFNRRSGPISAAIAITFDMPAGMVP